MKRHNILVLAALISAVTSSLASGQEWARKMFTETTHDFGAVARGAETVHQFVIENKFVEDVHIAGVRASCGCTTPSISKATLKTWEKGAILARFNTDRFMGRKGATVTVTIDKPFFAEVQLSVTGYIRPDVVFNPGVVNFGSVDQSSGSDRRVQVSYAGRSNWTITDVLSANKALEVRLNDPARIGNKVTYDMDVHLKPGAEAGFFKDTLTLVTNDGRNSRLTLSMTGTVRSSLTISPSRLSLGELQPGQQVTKKVIVQSQNPFTVQAIDVGGQKSGFVAEMPPAVAKKVHVIPITFRSNKAGQIEQQIAIDTNVGSGMLTAAGNVK